MNKLQKWIAGNILGMDVKASSASPNAMMPVGQFVELNGQVTWIADKLSSYITDGYGANDIIYSGVMMVMDKVRVAPWSLYKVVDESSLKKYQALVSHKMGAKEYCQAVNLRKKALEPMASYNVRTGKLNELLKWPNEHGTWCDLTAEGAGWKMLTGNEMLWGNMLEDGANKGIPQEILHAPAQYTKLIVTRGFPQRVTGYYLETDVKRFKKEEMLHLKFWNPQYDINGAYLAGMSPLKAASKTLTRNNAAKHAGSVQLQNNGAAGIAYVDDPIVPAGGRKEQISLVKREWAKEYAGDDNFGKIAFSGYKMGYTQVGMSLKDMALTELEEIDLRRLFNIWGIPSQLGNDPNNKTFNSLEAAEKALTTRCALPHLTSKRDHLNRKLQTDWGFKGVNVYADFDMTVYTELQEDQKEKWSWVKDLIVPEAYKLELMNLDVPDQLPKDLILVDSNKVMLTDIINSISDDEASQINEELNKSGLNDYR